MCFFIYSFKYFKLIKNVSESSVPWCIFGFKWRILANTLKLYFFQMCYELWIHFLLTNLHQVSQWGCLSTQKYKTVSSSSSWHWCHEGVYSYLGNSDESNPALSFLHRSMFQIWGGFGFDSYADHSASCKKHQAVKHQAKTFFLHVFNCSITTTVGWFIMCWVTLSQAQFK